MYFFCPQNAAGRSIFFSSLHYKTDAKMEVRRIWVVPPDLISHLSYVVLILSCLRFLFAGEKINISSAAFQSYPPPLKITKFLFYSHIFDHFFLCSMTQNTHTHSHTRITSPHWESGRREKCVSLYIIFVLFLLSLSSVPFSFCVRFFDVSHSVNFPH